MHRLFPNRLVTRFASVAVLALAAPVLVHAEVFPPLNRLPTKQQFPGKFIWADLFTNDPEAAAKFYCDLLGWTADDIHRRDKTYIVLNSGDHPVAGIVARPASATPRAGLWIGYISVLDAAASLARVAPAGGTERAPLQPFPIRGKQAIVSDSEGAVVGLLQSTSGDPIDDEPDPGEWNWFQLYARKPAVSAEFYRRTLGYEVHADTRPGRSAHLTLSQSGSARAGIAALPESPDARPGWLGVLRVTNIEATVARATALGGKTVLAPRPAALGSRFAVIADPTGAEVGLVQYVDSENPGDRP